MSFLGIEITVACIGLLVLMLDAFTPLAKRVLFHGAAVGVFLVFLVALLGANDALPAGMERFYAVDKAALFSKMIILGTTVVVLVMGASYIPVLQHGMFDSKTGNGMGEFASLPLFVAAGLMWLVSAKDFITLFIALELTTIGFYVLVASMRRNVGSLEAGVKYLILGALSTGFLVYGIAWSFGICGTFDLAQAGANLAQNTTTPVAAVLFAFALLLGGLGFKVAMVPFQFWAPDVYQGAPTPVSAFLSVGSKAAAIVVLARIMEIFQAHTVAGPSTVAMLLILASITMLLGSFGAIHQTNLKRLLGYSSITNAGFLLFAIASHGWELARLDSLAIVGIYMAGYAVMTLLAFYVIAHVRCETGSEDMSALRGLAGRNPLLATGMTLAMASLAGVPLTVGFVGKILVIGSGVSSGHMIAVICAALASLIGFYYYFRVIKAIFTRPDEEQQDAPSLPLDLPGKIVVGTLSFLVIVLGVYPKPIFSYWESPEAKEESVVPVSTDTPVGGQKS
jgi:NADH-quinone oxidoreductase subunit N